MDEIKHLLGVTTIRDGVELVGGLLVIISALVSVSRWTGSRSTSRAPESRTERLWSWFLLWGWRLLLGALAFVATLFVIAATEPPFAQAYINDRDRRLLLRGQEDVSQLDWSAAAIFLVILAYCAYRRRFDKAWWVAIVGGAALAVLLVS